MRNERVGTSLNQDVRLLDFWRAAQLHFGTIGYLSDSGQGLCGFLYNGDYDKWHLALHLNYSDERKITLAIREMKKFRFITSDMSGIYLRPWARKRLIFQQIKKYENIKHNRLILGFWRFADKFFMQRDYKYVISGMENMGLCHLLYRHGKDYANIEANSASYHEIKNQIKKTVSVFHTEDDCLYTWERKELIKRMIKKYEKLVK